MRILIVDDDPIAIELLGATLEERGYNVVTAYSGQEALDLLAAGEEFQIVISDWEMPGVDGLQLCQAVRERDAGGYIYFILLTAKQATRTTVAGLNAGADDFICKPFDPKELMARIAVAERLLAMETRDLTIFALAKLAESRDPETGSHLERVQRYSEVLARYMWRNQTANEPISPAFPRLIYQTSPLHDIGKVAVPDSVLLKPSRLSDEEFAIMKTHTELGADTLRAAATKHPNAEFLQLAVNIAWTHHERFDGSGYPRGLKAYDIPLCGRIVALADVYDALTSKRVYKAAFTHINAKSIIVKDSGKHFDPAVVEAFLACESQFLAIGEIFDGEGNSDRTPPTVTKPTIPPNAVAA